MNLNNKMNITQKMLLLVLLLFCSVVFAQSTPPPPNPPPPNGLPVDGFVWLGGIVALAYGGIKKYKNSKK